MGFAEILPAVLIGLAAGFLGGLLGVGGGVLMVPAFLFLLHDRIHDMKMAVGTSMAVIIATAVAATIVHHRGGRVNWQVVPWVAAFAIVGGVLGARVTGGTKPLLLRRIFAVLMLVVAVKMFFSNPPQKQAASGDPAMIGEAASGASAAGADANPGRAVPPDE